MKDLICTWLVVIGLIVAALVFIAGVVATFVWLEEWALVPVMLIAAGFWGASNMGYDEDEIPED